MNELYFSSTYSEARRRFRELASAVGATLRSYPIGGDADNADRMTIDVAILGPDNAPTLVTSSGVHGVEGFLGSAIQLAMLDCLANGRPLASEPLPRKNAARDVRHVMMHAVNPYGFAQLRRFDGDNIDLNRNFLQDEAEYRGAAAHYRRLNDFLNPMSPPKRLEPFRLKAIMQVCRFGMQALKQSIAEGQYEYPQGIFFGGNGPSQSAALIREHVAQWLGSVSTILHIDFHSGLGPFGRYKLLLAESADSERIRWYEDVFETDFVEPTNVAARTAYRTSGSFGEWLQQRFEAIDYRFVTAEFGTYGPLRVLAAIRAENRAHHYGASAGPAYLRAKRELLECFCPANTAWREQTVDSGLKIIQQGIAGLTQPNVGEGT